MPAATIWSGGVFTALNAVDGLIWGQTTHSLASLFPNRLSDYLSVGGARLYFANLGVWLLATVLVGALFALFDRTRIGLLMRATANNRASDLSGPRTGRRMPGCWL